MVMNSTSVCVSGFLRVATVVLGALGITLALVGYTISSRMESEWGGGGVGRGHCVNRYGSRCPPGWPPAAVLASTVIAALFTVAGLSATKLGGKKANGVVGVLYVVGGGGCLVAAGLAVFYGISVATFKCEFEGNGIIMSAASGGGGGTVDSKLLRISRNNCESDKQKIFRHGWFLAAGVVAGINAFLHFFTPFTLLF